jgi:hypothetical protein
MEPIPGLILIIIVVLELEVYVRKRIAQVVVFVLQGIFLLQMITNLPIHGLLAIKHLMHLAMDLKGTLVSMKMMS